MGSQNKYIGCNPRTEKSKNTWSGKNLRKYSFIVICFLICLGFFVSPKKAQAQGCESATQIASDLWEEYGKLARQIGCAGVTAATVVASAGASLPASVAQYKACMTASKETANITDGMIKAWNDMVNNSWAKIGPRRLELNKNFEGTIRGAGTRVYVTESPVTATNLNLSIEKLRFRGKTEVNVCTYLPDGSKESVWNFHIGRGNDNKGKTWNKEISDVEGRIVSVFLKGDPTIPGISAKSMKYKLRAEPQGELILQEPDDETTHTVIISSDGISGGTNYTLNGGGSLIQKNGTLEGTQVTIQSDDNVSGNTASGHVAGGADGFVVSGDLPSIQLENPQNAHVYVDGKQRHTIVVSGENTSGGTDYVIESEGLLSQKEGTLSGRQVTIQSDDKVDGNKATGHVAGGADGFVLTGNLSTLSLGNHKNADVYIDGTRAHTIVIKSDNISGSSSYQINGGGQIQPVEGTLSNMEVTIQGNDNVSGTTAEGSVGAGNDGFIITGQLPSVSLDEPNNATIYIDGQEQKKTSIPDNQVKTNITPEFSNQAASVLNKSAIQAIADSMQLNTIPGIDWNQKLMMTTFQVRNNQIVNKKSLEVTPSDTESIRKGKIPPKMIPVSDWFPGSEWVPSPQWIPESHWFPSSKWVPASGWTPAKIERVAKQQKNLSDDQTLIVVSIHKAEGEQTMVTQPFGVIFMKK